MRRPSSTPTFDYPCPNPDCDAEVEYEIEVESPGSYNEPPSGGFAYPTDEECPVCKTNLHADEAYWDKVYIAWCESCEPDYS